MTSSAPVRLSLSHPAAFDADKARELPIDQRGWYLAEIETPPLATKLGRGWEPLRATVDLTPGVKYELRAGPSRGPTSVRARFFVHPAGTLVCEPSAARLVWTQDDTVAGGTIVPAPERVAAPAPAPAAAPAPGTVTMTGPAETVSDVALSRVTADEEYLRRHGIALPPVVRVLGGRVNAIGVENFSISHRAWEEQPRTVDALGEVIETVRAERREDARCDRKAIQLRPDGTLRAGAWGNLHLESSGLRGLVGLFGDTLPGAAALLETLPADERAELVNRQIARSERTGVVRLRTREVHGRRQVFAVVGAAYAARDADALAADLIGALRQVPGGHDARGEVVYDAGSASLEAEALWHADHVVDLACGDVFKGGVVLRSSDNGGGSVQVWSEWLRNRCYNLIIVGKGAAPVARIQHRGTGGRWQHADRLARGLAEGLQVASRFAARWGYARTVQAADVLAELRGSRKIRLANGDEVTLRDAFARARTPQDTARTAYEAILDLPHLDLPARTDATVEQLLAGWRHEPGTTLADIVNGVTRVHDAAIPVATRQRFEAAAGLLLA